MVAVLTLGVERLAAMMAAERDDTDRRRANSSCVGAVSEASAAAATAAEAPSAPQERAQASLQLFGVPRFAFPHNQH